MIFVLATTDPQKVLPTIRSRTQHFEFRLLGADILAGLLRDVNDRAALGVPPEAIALVVRRGHGSARDALSALDQVAAAGTVDDEATILSDVIEALADRDPGRVLLEVAEAISAGSRSPAPRDGTPGAVARRVPGHPGPALVLLADDAVAAVEAQARRLGHPGPGASHGGARAGPHRHAGCPGSPHHPGGGAGAPHRRRCRRQPVRAPRSHRAIGTEDWRKRRGGFRFRPAVRSIQPPCTPRPQLRPPERHRRSRPPPVSLPSAPIAGPGRRRAGGASLPGPRSTGPAPPLAPAGRDPEPPPTPATRRRPPHAGPAPGRLPTREELTIAWGDRILPGLRPGVKVYLSSGRFVGVDDAAATYAVPDRGLLVRAEANRAEVEAALSAHFGRPVPLRLVLDDAGAGRSRRRRAARAGDGRPHHDRPR